MSTIDKKVQADTGDRRLLPVVYIVEKGQPAIFKSVGPSALYIIEGSYL